jgi:nitrite reductase/ring-hydroxylating ferredoxin subunit
MSEYPDRGSAETQPAWRQDFPIDLPDDQFIARRDFTKFMVLTSLAFVVGQFGIVLQSVLRRQASPPAPLSLGPLEALPVGGSRTFNFPGPNDSCLLLRPDERTLLACSQKCTHLSCAVVPRLAEGTLRCPCHDGVFDLEGRPLAGPPRRPLPKVRVVVRDGVVYATAVEAGLS